MSARAGETKFNKGSVNQTEEHRAKMTSEQMTSEQQQTTRETTTATSSSTRHCVDRADSLATFDETTPLPSYLQTLAKKAGGGVIDRFASGGGVMRMRGGQPLKGVVQVSGAKNAALPILIASLLTEERCSFQRVPDLHDIEHAMQLLAFLGVQGSFLRESNQVSLQANNISTYQAPYDLVKSMRASVYVLGPLLARFGEAQVSLPGGCAIGARPINLHLTGLEKLGATIELARGDILATARKGLRGNRISFDFPSVGATVNLLMAATLARGETVLENAAQEPEVVDLAKVLSKMGAHIAGAGTSVIHIQGKESLTGCSHAILGDRIEAGTFLMAAFMTQGDVRVEGIDPLLLESVLAKLEAAGARLTCGDQWVGLRATARPQAVDITTLPFPGFPTDLQAQFMALMSRSEGVSLMTETIFENRFMHVAELARMGADLSIHGNAVRVRGKERLQGAAVTASDLRASASLIIAGLAAEGETTLSEIYHLERGYDKMELKLKKLGAEIARE